MCFDSKKKLDMKGGKKNDSNSGNCFLMTSPTSEKKNRLLIHHREAREGRRGLWKINKLGGRQMKNRIILLIISLGLFLDFSTSPKAMANMYFAFGGGGGGEAKAGNMRFEVGGYSTNNSVII